MKSLRFASLFLFLILGYGCKHKTCMLPNPSVPTFFKVIKNGKVLSDTAILSKVSLYFFNASGKKIEHVDDAGIPGSAHYDYNNFISVAQLVNPNTPSFKNSGIMILSGMIPYIAYSQNIHAFYLQFPDGDVDTLTITAQRVSCEQGWKEQCMCTTPVRQVLFNGKQPGEDFSMTALSEDELPLYLFNK